MKKNVLIIMLVIIIGLLCCSIGWLIGSKFTDVGNESSIEDSTNQNNDLNLEDNIELNNYDLDAIKDIVLEIPVANSNDPDMKTVTITDKQEMKDILLNVDDLKEIGKIPDGIGFGFPVTITINYEGDPSTVIVFLGNGNLAINFALGAGETGYGEYEINNKNFRNELINKYQ